MVKNSNGRATKSRYPPETEELLINSFKVKIDYKQMLKALEEDHTKVSVEALENFKVKLLTQKKLSTLSENTRSAISSIFEEGIAPIKAFYDSKLTKLVDKQDILDHLLKYEVLHIPF